jgi:hypothetical protein
MFERDARDVTRDVTIFKDASASRPPLSPDHHHPRYTLSSQRPLTLACTPHRFLAQNKVADIDMGALLLSNIIRSQLKGVKVRRWLRYSSIYAYLTLLTDKRLG